MLDLISISVQIAERRRSLKLSQAALAKQAGVSRATVDALENARAGDLGEPRAGGPPAKIRQILERIGEAIRQTAKEVRAYIVEHPEFAEVGQRMLQEWQTGLRTSLLAI